MMNTRNELRRSRFVVIPDKGEIWVANLGIREKGEQGGVRPVMILQERKVCKTNDKIWVVPFTSRIKAMHLPVHILVKVDDVNKLENDSILEFEQIVKIPKTALIRKTDGKVGKEYYGRINKAINTQFDFQGF